MHFCSRLRFRLRPGWPRVGQKNGILLFADARGLDPNKWAWLPAGVCLFVCVVLGRRRGGGGGLLLPFVSSETRAFWTTGIRGQWAGLRAVVQGAGKRQKKIGDQGRRRLCPIFYFFYAAWCVWTPESFFTQIQLCGSVVGVLRGPPGRHCRGVRGSPPLCVSCLLSDSAFWLHKAAYLVICRSKSDEGGAR
jgi:hypothetical protein